MRKEAGGMPEPVPQLRLVQAGEHPAPCPGGPATTGAGPATSTPDGAGSGPLCGPLCGPATGRASGPPGGATNTGHQADVAPAIGPPPATSSTEASRPAAAPAGPAASAAAGTPGGELEPYGRPMTALERSWRNARHWGGLARQGAASPGGLGHGIIHGRPESFAQQHAYVESRAWVPDGHEGTLLPALGAIYGHTIAKAGMGFGYGIAWVFARPMRLLLTCLVTGAAVVVVVLTW